MTESRHEWRRRQVLESIERTALDLFSEQGYQSVTVAQIAEAVGISLRTFFRYFPTKDAVLVAWGVQSRLRLLHRLEQEPEDLDAYPALRNALIARATVTEEERPAVLKRLRVANEAQVLRSRVAADEADVEERIISDLARRMGVGDDPVPATVLFASMFGVAQRAFRAWVNADGHGDPATITAAYLDVLNTSFSGA
jgi:AcrR family transcriptional regulator